MIARRAVRLLLAALFALAALLHLADPVLFLPIMPPAIPFPIFCIQASGVLELLGAIGLLVPARTIQLLTGWGLILLLIAVFPANVYMAMAHVKVHGFPAHSWMGWARLPLQPLLMLAVAWVTGLWKSQANAT